MVRALFLVGRHHRACGRRRIRGGDGGVTNCRRTGKRGGGRSTVGVFAARGAVEAGVWEGELGFAVHAGGDVSVVDLENCGIHKTYQNCRKLKANSGSSST